MKKARLVRQDHREPDFKALFEMKDYLKNLLTDETLAEDESAWKEAIKEILAFQNEDGSFALLDSYRVENDAQVDFCHEPTYICTAILMKALLKDKMALQGREEELLVPAMRMCCARRLSGAGYDSLRGLIQAVNYFISSDVKTFLKYYSEMCPEFTDLFSFVEDHFAYRVDNEAFHGSWGENYEEEIRAIDEYFANCIFVYGTLMSGQPNHEAFLGKNKKITDGWIEGYDMYDLGNYPGIRKGEGRVFGEVYIVSDETLEQIDQLEGEGFLYRRVPVKVHAGKDQTIQAEAYVYMRSVEGYPRMVNDN